jgi:hypothetical protein
VRVPPGARHRQQEIKIMIHLVILGLLSAAMIIGYTAYLLTLSSPTGVVTAREGTKTAYLSLVVAAFVMDTGIEWRHSYGVLVIAAALAGLTLVGAYTNLDKIGRPSRYRTLDDKIIGVIRGALGAGLTVALFVLVFVAVV